MHPFALHAILPLTGEVTIKTHLITAALFLLAAPAQADIVEALPHGFEVKHELTIQAPAQRVYDALIRPELWWSASHTWSGSAANLSLEARAGCCYCEALPKGGMSEHMRVVSVQPGEGLRLFDGLGPLEFTGASGFWNVTLKEMDGVTNLTAIYDVGGYAKGGLDNWAGPVDRALSEQYGHLKALAETK